MKILDISVPISPALPFYPGDPTLRIERVSDQERGDPYTLSSIQMGAHTGTHVDAPWHFLPGGAKVDQLDLGVLIGAARVVDLTHVASTITARDLEAADLPPGTERVLCKTRNSGLWARTGFQSDYVALAADGARWLVERGVRLVGMDYVSADVFGAEQFQAHHVLLRSGVVILESISLEEVAPGAYHLICLPLRLAAAEAAPARAVLIQE